MRRKTAFVAIMSIVILGVWAEGVAAGNSGRRREQMPASRPARPVSFQGFAGTLEPGQPTRLQIDIFELICTNNQLADLDLNTIIAGDAQPRAILERLGKVGTARLLIRTDDTVDLLYESRITQGKQMPIIRDIVMSKGGTMTPSVSYQDAGIIAKIYGRWREENSSWADVVCNLELSNATRTHVNVSSDITMPAFNQFKVEKVLAVHDGKPVFTMGNGLPLPDDEQGKVNVTLIRLQASRLAQ